VEPDRGAGWLDPAELRVGLGCMRLSTDDDRDERLALETIAAAAAAGVTVFDTAHAYGRDEAEAGHNERLLARALRACGAERTARIVTKGGMTRASGGWLPDGRAKAILADCEASLAALDGLPVDLYLLHAPDPRTPWRTSLRALARLLDERLVPRVGLANVNRDRVDEALELLPVTAVQVALSLHDDRALRGGVVARCEERGVAVIAHSPLGGPRRAGSLARRPGVAEVAEAVGATPVEAALAWVLGLSPAVVAIPGARHAETARSAARAAGLRLGERERALLAGPAAPARRPARRAAGAEVVVVMGIPGAGKSRLAAELAGRGYLRLNRDERGGTLRALAGSLDEALASGVMRVVLDNTYLTRAARSHVVETAARHGVAARCLWLDTPPADAQVNLVERMLERLGRLASPEELRAARTDGLIAPTSFLRAVRELEPPSADEGLAAVERVAFVRRADPARTRAGVLVAAAALRAPGWERALAEAEPGAPCLVFDWRPDAEADALAPELERLAAAVAGPVEGAVCAHGGGPPSCWCRPPLPGLALAFARAHGVDTARSVLVGPGPAHRALAAALGARYVSPG
jgi:aryl-alcohol dehydrogenase-like predicted oxidoreductase/adenylate kinase family enzyme